MATANMALSLPTVSITAGPLWAGSLNTALNTIDAHDHSSGKGVKVTPSGLNINSNLNFNNYYATAVGSVRLTTQSSTLVTTLDKSCIYVVNGDLYYNNASGTPVQLTSGAGINIASVGTIGGDYGQSGVAASASYSDTLKTFSWTQASGVTAKMNMADVSISYPGASENAVTLKTQTGSAGYSLSFPLLAPAEDDSIQVYNASGVGLFKTIEGTENQVSVTSSADALTISLPSEISTTAGTFLGAITGGSLSISGAASIVGALTGGTGTFTTMNLTSLLIGGKTVINSSGGANAYSSAGALLSRSSANSFSINVGSSVVTIGYSNITNAGSGAIGIETSTTFSSGVSGFGISFRGGIAYQMHPVSGTNRMQDTSSDSYSNGIVYVMIHQR